MAILAAVLAFFAVSVRAEASPTVYWAHFNGSTLESVPADGSEAPQTLITGAKNPLGVAVDDSHVYWANFSGGSIGRANLDGTEVEQEFIAGIEPFALAVSEGHIYWTDANSKAIGRANLDGTDVEPNFIEGVGAFFGIAADFEHLYWGDVDDESIGRANLDGTGVETEFVKPPGGLIPYGVAVDEAHLYWANSVTNAVGRADLAGGDIEEEFIPEAHPAGVAVDAGHIYWGYAIYQGSLGRANVDGSEAENEWQPSATTDAFGIAVTPWMTRKPPASPAVAPDSGPAPCEPVATSAATFTPTPRAGKLVPGVRALIRVAAPSQLQVGALLTYRLHGRTRKIDLGSHTLHDSSTAKLRLPLPAKHRSAPAIGTKVSVQLEITTSPDGLPGCRAGEPSVSVFRAKVVRVLP